jgi:hypothetical protein
VVVLVERGRGPVVPRSINGMEEQPVSNSTTIGETREELMQYYEGLLEAQDREVGRLRSVIRGCEIALNRDEYPDGARRLIREERANHGW